MLILDDSNLTDIILSSNNLLIRRGERDYAVLRNNQHNLLDIPSPNSIPTKKATIGLGGRILFVNYHFLTRNDNFPIERTGRLFEEGKIS